MLEKYDNSVIDMRRTVIKVWLLTGTYYLKADRVKFQRRGALCLCQLCAVAPEDMLHFVTTCASLQRIRMSYLVALGKRLIVSNSVASISSLLSDSPFLFHLVVDCSSSIVWDKLTLSESDCFEIETISRRMCFTLHLSRCRLLKQPT